MSRLRVPKLLRLLYVHNPFYLLSACLFVYGLQIVFRPGDVEFLFDRETVAYINPWALMLSLCGVTLLMATTAFLIVKLGKVWEDARSLVLVLLLMFMSISVSFDEIMTLTTWNDGSMAEVVGLFLFGFGFAVSITEALVRGLGIRFGWAYRGPFYGFLGMFFAYPLLVAPELANVTAEEARWRIAAFPLLAGLLTLSLMPAVRRGSVAVRDNGTPWRWPLFPWTVFVFVGAAVCFRSFSLAISFDLANAHSAYWDTSFGLYLLVPFLLAVLFLLYEIGMVEQIPLLQKRVLGIAPLLLLVAYPWLGPWTNQYTYQRFAYEMVQTIGSPVLVALAGLLLLYGVAWWRGNRQAELGFLGCLLVAVFIEPRSFGARTYELTLDTVQIWPLLVLGTLEIVIGLRQRCSRSTLVGMLAIVLAGRILVNDPGESVVSGLLAELARFKSTVSYHLILGSVLMIGGTFRDEFARRLRLIGAPALIVTSLAAIGIGLRDSVGIGTLLLYGSAMTGAAFLCWLWLKHWLYLLAAMTNIGCGVLAAGLAGYRSAQHVTIPAGFKPLFWASLCFAAGVLISLLKSRQRPVSLDFVTRSGNPDVSSTVQPPRMAPENRRDLGHSDGSSD